MPQHSLYDVVSVVPEVRHVDGIAFDVMFNRGDREVTKAIARRLGVRVIAHRVLPKVTLRILAHKEN